MQQPEYTAPSLGAKSFNCPHSGCRVYAHQCWYQMMYRPTSTEDMVGLVSAAAEFSMDPLLTRKREQRVVDGFVQCVWVSECQCCYQPALWIHDRIVSPDHGNAPSPNPDLPAAIREDYEEAGRVLDQSPRSSAALLRLVVERLCEHLDADGGDLNSYIKGWVRQGLGARLQQALDSVRVVGNNSVHPGQIDMKDDRATAESLFHIVNFIADRTITDPKKIKQFYEDVVPEDDKRKISKRDDTA